jgi:glycerol-3-phosphate dehydrogenase
MEAANERRVLRRLAPYLARPIKVIVPVHGRSGYATLAAGLWTFDRMARVRKDERNQMLGQEETLALEPHLKADVVYGAGVYYECLTDDARLVMANIRSAAALGAVAVNYARVTGFLSEGSRLTAAVVHDTISGTAFPVQAKVIVNAAGPWVDAVRALQGAEEQAKLHLTKGIHLVLPRDRLPVSHIVIMNARDKRSVFATPRGDIVYLGTTDTDYQGRYDDPPVTTDDALYLLEAANKYFDVDPLTLSDVVGAWAGLRPLLHQEGKKPTEISRKDDIMVGPTGLLSIAGGKLTTYRCMAERTVAMIVSRLQDAGVLLPAKRGDSDADRLCGGEMDNDVEGFAGALKMRWPKVPADIVDRLVRLCGSDSEHLVEGMAADPTLARRCAPDSPVSHGEVQYAVREEMALTLEDYLERRARLFLWDVHNGLNVAHEVAQIMGEMLDWDRKRIDAEVAAYRRHVDDVKAFLPPLEATPQRAANA